MAKNTMRFDEDSFDLAAHKKAAEAIVQEKARAERNRRLVKRGKIIVAIVAMLIFFALFYLASQLGWMSLF